MSKSASVKFTENGVTQIVTVFATRYLHVWVCVNGNISMSIDGKYRCFHHSTKPSLVSDK